MMKKMPNELDIVNINRTFVSIENSPQITRIKIINNEQLIVNNDRRKTHTVVHYSLLIINFLICVICGEPENGNINIKI